MQSLSRKCKFYFITLLKSDNHWDTKLPHFFELKIIFQAISCDFCADGEKDAKKKSSRGLNLNKLLLMGKYDQKEKFRFSGICVSPSLNHHHLGDHIRFNVDNLKDDEDDDDND